MFKSNKIIIAILCLISFLTNSNLILAYVASSSSYTLEKDSINFSGTENSSSTLYQLSDTVGEVGTGDSSSDTYNLNAGYRAMEVGTYITLTAPADITLTEINSNAGGMSEGTAAWTVTTNNSNGYRLSVKASTDPALQSGANSFADYTPTGAVPDYNWSVATNLALFGFTPEGSHIVSRFLDNGADTCGVGANNTSSTCWDTFATTDTTIAEDSSSNNPAGTATTVRIRAEIGTEATVATGDYSTVLTVTAITL
ncbi:MAG: hypothetical protein WDZ73_01675 [Candidatus Paceibacterota bacterium]